MSYLTHFKLVSVVELKPVAAVIDLSPDRGVSHWFIKSFAHPFDSVATAVEPYLDHDLVAQEKLTDLFPPILKAIILDSSRESHTRIRWLLVYIENSANKELQEDFLRWMKNVEGLEFLVRKPLNCKSCVSIVVDSLNSSELLGSVLHHVERLSHHAQFYELQCVAFHSAVLVSQNFGSVTVFSNQISN